MDGHGRAWKGMEGHGRAWTGMDGHGRAWKGMDAAWKGMYAADLGRSGEMTHLRCEQERLRLLDVGDDLAVVDSEHLLDEYGLDGIEELLEVCRLLAARPTLGERVGDESVRVDEEGSLRLAHRVQACQTILRDGRRWREKKSGKVMEMWGDVGRCGEMWGDVGRCRTCRRRSISARIARWMADICASSDWGCSRRSEAASSA